MWLPLISDSQRFVSYNPPGRVHDCKAYKFSIYASPWGVSEETVRTVEDMVRDQGYTDGTLHISVVNVMFWINQNEYEFMKQIRSYV